MPVDGKNRELRIANFRCFKTWILDRYRKREGMESRATFRHLAWETGWVGMLINDKGTSEKETICVGGGGMGSGYIMMGFVWVMLDFRCSQESEMDIQSRELFMWGVW